MRLNPNDHSYTLTNTQTKAGLKQSIIQFTDVEVCLTQDKKRWKYSEGEGNNLNQDKSLILQVFLQQHLGWKDYFTTEWLNCSTGFHIREGTV